MKKWTEEDQKLSSKLAKAWKNTEKKADQARKKADREWLLLKADRYQSAYLILHGIKPK
jgi:hypothetical protein